MGYYKQKPKLHIIHIPLEEHCMQSLTQAKKIIFELIKIKIFNQTLAWTTGW